MNRIYWLIPIIIFVLQAIYTFSSMNQIRFEEVIETFRSTWWFQNGLVWNGSYTSLGWSGTLVFIYNIFGINLFTPKLIKLSLELVSFFFLGSVLKKHLGVKTAIIPLLLIGLSPTFIYFNSLSMSHGLDVSYFFILIYLIDSIDFKRKIIPEIKHFLMGIIAIFATLNYAGFLFFLPLLGLFYMYKVTPQKIRFSFNFIAKNAFFSMAGIILPLFFFFLFIQNRELLIYDPVMGKGLFRSYGTIDFSIDVIKDNFYKLTQDLFVTPVSYYFEQKKVEFSDIYPVGGVILVFTLSIIIFIKNKKSRFYIGCAIGLLISYFLLLMFIGPVTLGGLRRGTVLLTIFYGLFTVLWKLILSDTKLHRVYKLGIIVSAVLLLLHHLAVYPENLRNLKKESFLKDKVIFIGFEDPERQYNQIIDSSTKSDTYFLCLESFDKRTICPGSSLIYSLVAGTCYWNNLTCHKVIGSDNQINKHFELNLSFWGSLPHTEP